MADVIPLSNPDTKLEMGPGHYQIECSNGAIGSYRIVVHDIHGTGDNGDYPTTIEIEFGGQHGNGDRGAISDGSVVFSFCGNWEWGALPDLLIKLGKHLEHIRGEVL